MNIKGHDSRRLNIDRKMIGILSVFAVFGTFLVITIVIATNTLSGLRGFASLQTYWTEARKEASLQLANFIESSDPAYYVRFDSAMQYVHKAETVRVELLKDGSDHAKVKKQLGDIYSVPRDLDFMITTFEYFHTFPDFKEAIVVWDESNGYMKEMQELADFSRQLMEGSEFDDETRKAAIKELFYLDRKLTEMQHRLARSLSDGAHLLNTIIMWIAISIGAILLITGFMLSFRFLKSMKKWHRVLEISEQQYRSLFEQNPNAVCYISRDGLFIEGNNALEIVTGYTLDELKGENFIQFFEAYELEKIEEYFQKTLNGEPQSYETMGIKKNGDRIYSEITSLPIIVDGEIVGVYGVIHDITDRKTANRKIEDQLEEKTHLLTEIHDRVKNNLALISTLIQLQRTSITDNMQSIYWDRTISRVHSMAMVHERIYATDSFSEIAMDGCIHDLCKSVSHGKLPPEKWTMKIRADKIYMGIKQAMSVGLLLNEILENLSTAARAENAGGVVEIAFYDEGEETVLNVNMKADAEDISLTPDPSALGMKLIKVLVKQLKGNYSLRTGSESSIEVRFVKNTRRLRKVIS